MTTEASGRAQAAMQRADWAGALKAFGEVLAKTPDDVAALMYCGIAQGQSGDLAAAARFLPESSDPEGRRLDIPGMLAGVVGTLTLMWTTIFFADPVDPASPGFRAPGSTTGPPCGRLKTSSPNDDRLVHGLPGYQRFDSLAVEECGNVCVATLVRGGISVFSPGGELVDFHEAPEGYCTNICFGGRDMRTAYITLSGYGQLFAANWPRPGMRLFA